jgi:hypothetical protein
MEVAGWAFGWVEQACYFLPSVLPLGGALLCLLVLPTAVWGACLDLGGAGFPAAHGRNKTDLYSLPLGANKVAFLMPVPACTCEPTIVPTCYLLSS